MVLANAQRGIQDYCMSEDSKELSRIWSFANQDKCQMENSNEVACKTWLKGRNSDMAGGNGHRQCL